MMRKKILATGGKGYVISLLSKSNPQYEWIKLDKEELDLSKPDLVYDVLNQYDFDYVIHAGAIPGTKECEEMPELTHKVNVESTKAIARYCKEKNKRLVFTSSEQVFNACQGGAYDEEHEVCSFSAYGKHKIECEQYIQNQLEDYIIIRFSWLFGMCQKGIKVSYNLLDKVFDSVFFHKAQMYPVNEIRGLTYAQKVADHLENLLALPTGIYHITSENSLNTYECAKKIAQYLGVEKEVIQKYILPDHDKYKDFARDFHMSNQKLKANGIDLGSFDQSVVECLKDYGWYDKGFHSK